MLVDAGFAVFLESRAIKHGFACGLNTEIDIRVTEIEPLPIDRAD